VTFQGACNDRFALWEPEPEADFVDHYRVRGAASANVSAAGPFRARVTSWGQVEVQTFYVDGTNHTSALGVVPTSNSTYASFFFGLPGGGSSAGTLPVNETIAFDATRSSGNGNLSFDWDWGDGTTSHSSANRTTHVFDRFGQFSVLLTVTDCEGTVSLPRWSLVWISSPLPEPTLPQPATQNVTTPVLSSPGVIPVLAVVALAARRRARG
jgi:hypothetical protein